MNRPCTAVEMLVDGIQAVRMENEWLRTVILVGKGTDIWELIYKPLNLELLMHTKNGLIPLADRDLRENRLIHYAEVYPGGWQEIIPNRAFFGNGEVDRHCEGESAGVPWEYTIDQGDGQSVSLICRLALPYTPLTVEKTISLSAGESELHIAERVVNTDSDTVHFIWTHHPAFGGSLIDEHAQVIVPESSVAFNIHRYEQNGGEPLEHFEEEITSVSLPSGNRKNLLKVDPRMKDGESCYIPLKNLNEGKAGIINPSLNVKLLLRWDHGILPCLRYWSNNDDEMYTLALEPSSSWFSDIHDCIRHGNCISLKPQEERRFWLNIRVEQL
jgi:galactose mutarotase-like enzyme